MPSKSMGSLLAALSLIVPVGIAHAQDGGQPLPPGGDGEARSSAGTGARDPGAEGSAIIVTARRSTIGLSAACAWTERNESDTA